MNKARCKGIIFEYGGELKCYVPNKPIVMVSPSYEWGCFDSGRREDELQVMQFEPDAVWFKTKMDGKDGELDSVIFYDKNIVGYVEEITGGKASSDKLKKIKEIVKE